MKVLYLIAAVFMAVVTLTKPNWHWQNPKVFHLRSRIGDHATVIFSYTLVVLLVIAAIIEKN